MRLLPACLCLAAVLFCHNAVAQEAAAPGPARIAAAAKVVESSGGTATMESLLGVMTPQILAELRRTNPRIGEEALQIIGKMLTDEMRASLPQLMEAQAYIYATRFSLEELQELVRFYESPIGKRLVTETPALARDSVQAGQAWGMASAKKALEKIIAQLRAQGMKI
jgi:hypothetical protein